MIATTGFFDGVHLGHRLVIERLVSMARKRGDESLVVTFWPHPRAVLQDGARELRLLTTLEEKKALLFGLGVDRVEVLDFSRTFAALTAAVAAAAVLTAVLALPSVGAREPKDTFDDPQLAYAQVEEAFQLIGQNMAKIINNQ